MLKLWEKYGELQLWKRKNNINVYLLSVYYSYYFIIMALKIEDLKTKIEKMDDIHQIHIGSILKRYPEIKLNTNKSGILINIATIPEPVLEEIQKYVHHSFALQKLM